jgi:hypothetical protein
MTLSIGSIFEDRTPTLQERSLVDDSRRLG